MTAIDDEALARLRSLLAKATPGEWHAGPYGTIQRTNPDGSHGSCVAITCSKSVFYEGWQENTPLIAAAINALPALLDIAEAVQWQPIETAPMDGELICVCIPGKTYSWPAWWRQRTAFDRRHKTGWHSGSNAPLKFRPTHWKPLPKPPVVVPCTGGAE